MAPRRVWQAAAAGWAGVILVTAMLPTQSAVETVSRGHDDLATTAGHFAAYALLGVLLAVALGGWGAEKDGVILALALAAGFGGLIEVVQVPLPYRDGQLIDAIVNVAGAAVGLVAFSAVATAQRSRSRRG
jgi:VanZ family protein